MTVTGVDMNRDGIPDVLQQQQYATYAAQASYVSPAAQYAAPAAQYTAAPAVYAAPAAQYTVTGVDMNHDGIPDVLQQQQYATYAGQASYVAPGVQYAAPAAQYTAAPAVYAAPA